MGMKEKYELINCSTFVTLINMTVMMPCSISFNGNSVILQQYIVCAS